MARFDKSFVVTVALRQRKSYPYDVFKSGSPDMRAAHKNMVRAAERSVSTAAQVLGIPQRDVRPRLIAWTDDYVARFEVQTRNGYSEKLAQQLTSMYNNATDYEIIGSPIYRG